MAQLLRRSTKHMPAQAGLRHAALRSSLHQSSRCLQSCAGRAAALGCCGCPTDSGRGGLLAEDALQRRQLRGAQLLAACLHQRRLRCGDALESLAHCGRSSGESYKLYEGGWTCALQQGGGIGAGVRLVSARHAHAQMT